MKKRGNKIVRLHLKSTLLEKFSRWAYNYGYLFIVASFIALGIVQVLINIIVIRNINGKNIGHAPWIEFDSRDYGTVRMEEGSYGE